MSLSDQVFETVELTFDTRQKSRFRATLANGTDIGADLPRTGILRSGSFIATNEGEVLRIDAKPEQLMQVTAETVNGRPPRFSITKLLVALPPSTSTLPKSSFKDFVKVFAQPPHFTLCTSNVCFIYYPLKY